ncbi:MAG: flagellar basal body-associated protein FliL [Parvularculaceae bacterium]
MTQGETPVDDASPAPARKGGALMIAGVSVLASSLAGAGMYFLSPDFIQIGKGAAPRQPQHAAAEKTEAHAKKPAADKPKAAKSHKQTSDKAKADTAEDGSSKSGGEFRIQGEIALYVPNDIVVTVSPQGRVRYLKIGLAVETTPESEAIFIERGLRIRDILNAYLRAVTLSSLEDPSAMARLRAQIARRIAFVVDPAPVNAVLITDFILS